MVLEWTFLCWQLIFLIVVCDCVEDTRLSLILWLMLFVIVLCTLAIENTNVLLMKPRMNAIDWIKIFLVTDYLRFKQMKTKIDNPTSIIRLNSKPIRGKNLRSIFPLFAASSQKERICTKPKALISDVSGEWNVISKE